MAGSSTSGDICSRHLTPSSAYSIAWALWRLQPALGWYHGWYLIRCGGGNSGWSRPS
jgi:hypothetical protein